MSPPRAPRRQRRRLIASRAVTGAAAKITSSPATQSPNTAHGLSGADGTATVPPSPTAPAGRPRRCPSCAAARLRSPAEVVGVVFGEVWLWEPEKPPVGTSVYDGEVAVPCPVVPAGVGSNRSQPAPWKYSCGQACASWVVTSQVPPYPGVPAVKP